MRDWIDFCPTSLYKPSRVMRHPQNKEQYWRLSLLNCRSYSATSKMRLLAICCFYFQSHPDHTYNDNSYLISISHVPRARCLLFHLILTTTPWRRNYLRLTDEESENLLWQSILVHTVGKWKIGIWLQDYLTPKFMLFFLYHSLISLRN